MEYTFDELATIKYGKNQKLVESPDGTIPIYGTGGLMGYATKALYDKPSVLIGRKGTIDKVKFIDTPFWTVDTLFYTEINEEIVLKGASVFCADLIREIDLDVRMDFMVVSSYGNETSSSGTVKIIKDLDVDIENKNVLIVEDIIDSGLTLSSLVAALETRKPKSLKLCTLLDKPERRTADIKVDYVGYVIEDKFIVGYGIDFAEKYRNLPYIGIVEDI